MKAKTLLIVLLVIVFVGTNLLVSLLLRDEAQTRKRSCWSMIDALEQGRITSTATTSAILRHADVALNSDYYLVANRWGMKKRVTIQNEQRSVIFAPSETSMQFGVHVPPGAVLEFGYGIAPEAWSKPGDGCEFSISIQEGRVRETLFLHYVNPKRRQKERRWFDARLDLSGYARKAVQLTFLTRGTYKVRPPFARGPDERFDYALWSNPIIYQDDEWLQGTNVVLISIDTLRADHVSCLGYHRKTTPALDALASEGVVFENAITPAPWTLPAHTSLFTGLLPCQHGVQNYHQRLADEALTLAERLREASFLTLGISSFDYLFPEYGLAQGYDEYLFRYPLRAEKIAEKALDMLDRHRGKRFFLFLHFFVKHG